VDLVKRTKSASLQTTSCGARRNVQRIMFLSSYWDRSPMKWVASRFQASTLLAASST
jgi:hypothetical protein